MTKQKLTLDELIKSKEKLDRKGKPKKRQTLYLDELDATVVIEEPEFTLVKESQELAADVNYEGHPDEFLVYNVLVEPNLKDPELQKAYGCAEPQEIVSRLFNVGTISGIGVAAVNLAGYRNTAVPIDKLKN